MNARNRGKSMERAIAKIFQFDNARRIGILGKEDIITDRFIIEVKERKKLPKFMLNAYRQIEKHRTKDKIPLFILHELNKNHMNDFVILKLKDFLEIIKND
ncbi:hypothetical protein J7J62_08145 [bacterium]|nr:hypothetical protein [bacterium]